MKKLWTYRDIDASAELLWDMLTDTNRWADWGPSVRGAELNSERLELGATGTVKTAVGVDLNFEITAYNEGVCWGWKVAGVPATDHSVKPLGPSSCRVGFGVPWLAAPYLAVCGLALCRLDTLADNERAKT